MDKLEINIPTKPSQLDPILVNMVERLNFLLDEMSELRVLINRCEKKYPNGRNMNPYDLNQVGYLQKKSRR